MHFVIFGAVECSSKSSHKMPSSVPSIAFEMLHFLNERATISAGRLFHASSTHWHMVPSDAALTFPPACALSPSIIQKPILERLVQAFIQGCKMLVSPPGISVMSVLVSLTARLTESTKCALKESQISKLFFRSRPPGRDFQTFWIQSFNPASSIQPCLVAVDNHSRRKLFFGHGFQLRAIGKA